jgi:hypothetical protein
MIPTGMGKSRQQGGGLKKRRHRDPQATSSNGLESYSSNAACRQTTVAQRDLELRERGIPKTGNPRHGIGNKREG